MDTNISHDSKKVNLDELSKEELLKKCRGLLSIAQKAKQAKDLLQEENVRLKQELDNKNKDDVSKELIENLTQQKLSLVTTIEDLKARNSSLDSKLQIYEKELQTCQEKLNIIDNENIAYRRQITRLTDENEQLISNLDTLEKQIDELNKIGIKQREQLLELESKAQDAKKIVDGKTVEELQRMLSVSLEEVKKLKSERDNLNEKIDNLEINLSEKNKNTLLITEQLKLKCDTLNKVTEELHELKTSEEAKKDVFVDYNTLRTQYEKLVETNKSLEKDIQFNIKLEENINDLQALNTNLKERLKLYRSKIIKFAGNVKALKEEKNIVLQLFKQYTDQVKEWKEKLNVASNSLIEQVNTIENENQKLKEEITCLKQENNTNSDLNEELDEVRETYESQIQKLKQTHKNEIETLKEGLKEYELQCSNLTKAAENSLKTIEDYKNQVDVLNLEKESISKDLLCEQNVVSKLTEEILLVKDENTKLNNDLKEWETKCLNLSKEIENLSHSNIELKKEVDILINEKKSVTIVTAEKDRNIKKQLDEYQNIILNKEQLIDELKSQIKKYEEEKQHIESIEKKLAEKSSEEILKLSEENKELLNVNTKLHEKIDELHQKKLSVSHCDSQTGNDLITSNEFEEQVVNMKRDNIDLLSDMNEMNQALKERGEHISKLEAHCEEIMKKLQIYETQANKNVDCISEKEQIIKNLREEVSCLKKKSDPSNDPSFNTDASKDEEISGLKSEIENLKEKLNSNLETSYAESETMSTSTVSRTEEMNRLRDLEGSWEERYGKLRNLAIKLKGKIRELSNTLTKEQTEKDDLQKKIALNLKTIQTLQNQSDKLEDELEASKQECKQYLNRLNSIAEDISKDKQSLVSQDDVITELKKEIDTLKMEKQLTDNWKKQVSAKVQTLRKELEANNLLKKDFENKITKLTADVEAKDQALKAEIESHKQTKNLLDASNNECKKNSVLNLEMQDYERSVKETAKKLEKQQEQISKLTGQVESQKSTINALREQNKILEERIQELEESLCSATTEISTYKKKINQLEEEIQQKEDKIQNVTQLLETARSETEELSTELSKVIAEHQKVNSVLKTERDHLRSQTLGLQQNLRDAQDALKLKEDELMLIKREYDGYKVRAQSVLRQNQNRDVGLEDKLAEELANLKVQNSELSSKLKNAEEKIRIAEEHNEKLTLERDDFLKKTQELETDIEELKIQYTQLTTKYQTTVNEHAETVRSLKLHADTLSQCYRQQIAEQESRHNREIVELQSRIEKSSSPVDSPVALPTMTREEGEGSESIESNIPPKTYPVPLERLLGSDTDQELVYMKKQIAEQESKLVHLTALLSDTEQDLAKHVQMNDLLKEEIRRQQRSEEREKHAENLEYLKNVVFKFVTLHSGDERSRLVPVLNTILKLSPEEAQKLNSVARGESGLKGWTNYLPTWSSPTKPQ